MKKWLTILILIVMLGLGAWYLAGEKANRAQTVRDPHAKLQVLVSNYAIYTLAREIGGDLTEISLLVPPGTEPHHFEPTPGSIIEVNQADLFIYASAQTEPWIKDLLRGLGKVRSLAVVPTEAENDSHLWLSPYGALTVAKHIATGLEKADPTHKASFRANLQKFEQAMHQLHADFEKGLSNCKHREVLHIGHLAFEPLAETYGLDLVSLTGTAHQGEHSVLKLTGFVRLIRNRRLPVLFTEELVPPDLAQTIVRETKVKLLPLYTIEEVSKSDFERAVTYEEYMRRNLKNLQEGLRCQV